MSYYYTVYLNHTEEIVAAGSARECAKQLNKTINGFHSLVSKNRRKIHHKYTVVVEPCICEGEKDTSSEE